MSSLEREWALVLPNGRLLMDRMTDQEPNPYAGGPFGSMAEMFGRVANPEPPKVRLFPIQQAAQQVADFMAREAKKVGVDDLLVVPVARWCGPWQTSDVGDQIARSFLTYIQSEQS